MTTSNKRRYLVLFTNDYPYGQGEYFLENELPIIAAKFEKITIIANSKNQEQTRQLPSNCQAYNCPITKSTFLRLKLIAQNCFILKKILATDHRLISLAKHKWPVIKSLLTIMLWGEEKLAKAWPLIKDLPAGETILYSYWMDHNSYAASRLKQRQPAYRALTRAHGCDLYTERTSTNYLPLRSYLANSLDQLVFISRHGENYFRNKVPATDNSTVCRLGTRRTDKILSPAGTDNIKHLLSVSNLIPLKQVHLIIEALAICKSKWQWTHFGDGPERPQLETLAQTKNINFKFMGTVSNRTILDFYANNPVDCFINVSSTEGLPVSIMEALSFGVPAVAPAINGIPEIVTPNTGRLLSPAPTVQEIAGALDELASLDSDAQHQLRQKARNFWETEYNAEIVFTKFINVLKGI